MIGTILGATSSSHYSTTAKPVDEWKGKPICKTEWQSRCCTDGYDIEGALDEAYENGIESHPLVTKLEDYPCITLRTFRTWVDKLSDFAFETMESPEALEKKRSDDLKSVSEAIRAFEKSDREDISSGRIGGASPFRSKKAHTRAK